MEKKLLLLLTWFFVVIPSLAQDSLNIVILSPKVGEVIDKDEREQYSIFKQYKDFSQVIFYKKTNNEFIAKFSITQPDGSEKDTLVRYSELVLFGLSEKIENWEKLKTGDYRMGQNPPKITIVNEGFITKQDFLLKQKEIKDSLYRNESTKNFPVTKQNSITEVSAPWGNSLYLSAGWGTPQGFRFELGYNIGMFISLGLSFGIGDMWSRDPGEGTFAILGSIRFPINSLSITPYLLFSRGSKFSMLGNPDAYTLINLGTIVPLIPWLQLRPEIGLAFTSKHISGGRSWFGGSSPEVTEDKTRFGFNISFEVDF
ncbi:MAG: hypothetical protein Q7S39_06385 [Ignavibacteria bacterium]|nr:hypothetical protein [Ignavibacteria bacterium]